MATESVRGDVASAGITWDSTREEVLAAVEEHERKMDEVRKLIRSDGTGSWSACRNYAADREMTSDELLLERQRWAGEEDQSVPGWDQGA